MKQKDLSAAWSDYDVLLTDAHWPLIHQAFNEMLDVARESCRFGFQRHPKDARRYWAEIVEYMDYGKLILEIQSVPQIRSMSPERLSLIREALLEIDINTSLLVEAQPDGPIIDELDRRFQIVRPIVSRGSHEIGYLRDVQLYGIEDPYPPTGKRVAIARVDRGAVWEKTEGRCWYCGLRLNPFTNFHIDHIHPVSLGGTNLIGNLAPACSSCNVRKAAFTVDEFRIRFGKPFWFEEMEEPF